MSFSRLLPLVFHPALHRHRSSVGGVWPFCHLYGFRLIRQWSETGEGVVIHTPAYDAFYKAIEGNQRTVMPVALEKQADGWFCDMASWKPCWRNQNVKLCSCVAHRILPGKCGRAMSWRSWLTCASVMVCGLFPMKSIWIWFGASSRIFPGVMWLAEMGVANVGSKSFNIPALTGAYGL